MSEQDKLDILKILKARLNRLDDLLDEYLSARIDSAIEELEHYGISLVSGDMRDLMLVVDLTAFEYSSRDKDGSQPDWLRLRIRERFLSERVKA